jgi:hypothetical protein
VEVLTTYTNERLRRALGNMSGKYLGLETGAGGDIEPIPQSKAEIVHITSIYPKKGKIQFQYRNDTQSHITPTIYEAYIITSIINENKEPYYLPKGRDKYNETGEWYRIPEKSIEGVVIPLDGDKNNGLLFLGYITLEK